jgi:hypothetical protein
MSSTDSETTPSKEEKRRIQLREAQRRYYNAHKRKEKKVPSSYDPEHIRTYHKSYYEKNKEMLNARAKERYNQRKQDAILSM